MDKTVARLRHDGEVERAVITLREITQELRGRGISAVMILEEHIQALENEITRLTMGRQPIGLSALTDVLERMRARADNAYCDYIGQLRRDECLGWEIKVERGQLGEAEMKVHWSAAEKLGRHRALHDAANMLTEVLRYSGSDGAASGGN